MFELTKHKEIRIYHDATVQGEVEKMQKDGEDMIVILRVKGAFPKPKPVAIIEPVNNQLDMFEDNKQ